ncbi:response regulator [Azospirillum halopraeferens]|uniref:response regulator n=1 Tax=Azospirillum halopraeferens TaxID=34010 RepID=UPI000424DE0C|nr:response regulator [Azospirillum halopraeferens]
MSARPIAVIDASPTQSLLYRIRLEERGLEVVGIDSLAGAAALGTRAPAAVLVNLRTLAVDAGAAVAAVRAAAPDVALVLVGDGTGGSPPPGVHRVAGGDPDAVVAEVCRVAAEDRAPASAPAARPGPEEVFRRGRILVVDDSVTYREFLRLELEDAGCTVVVTGGAGDAFAALEAEAFDVIIVDLVMPGVSGTELCEAFDRFRRERDLLFDILVHTSQDRAELLISCLQGGADEFVGKSQPLEVLKVRILALLRRKFFIEDALLG